MNRTIEAIYRNGHVELPPDVQLPENTRVTVIVSEHIARELPTSRRDYQQTLQALAASGNVQIPEPTTDAVPYVRQTPVPISGKPVSEIIVEQRG